MKLRMVCLLVIVAVVASVAGCKKAPPQPPARDHWVAPGKFKELKDILPTVKVQDLDAGTALHSINGATKSWMVLHNETSKTLTVYWINYDGHRQKYGTIAPGKSYDGQTFATHPWLLVDESDQPVALYVAVAGNCYAYLKGRN